MFITDKIWKLLEPACEMGDNASRKELEEGLKRLQKDLVSKPEYMRDERINLRVSM